MKKISIALLLLMNLSTFGQNLTKEDIDKRIKPLKTEIESLKKENSKLKVNLKTLDASLETLQKQSDKNSFSIKETANELGLKISTSETAVNQKISVVDKSLSKNSLYGIIGVLFVLLLSAILYWLLSKRQNSDKLDLIEQLSKTKSSIEESLIKEFTKQTELLEANLLVIEEQKVALKKSSSQEIDHSLALKVADQIATIERSINLIDSKTKGLQRIINSITNLKDNLSANGYEIPLLLGKPFNQGMNLIIASSIIDDTLSKEVEIISRIIKPQVNYNDKMIQAAQVEVSVGV